MTFKTYTSRETVKARKVTDKDGETIVTGNGFLQAAKGDYVVDTRVYETVNGENVQAGGGFDVIQAEEFERRFKARSQPARAPRKASASGSATARVKGAQKGATKAKA